LDDWVADRRHRRLDLVKLDVEGGEMQVLAGARRTLERSGLSS
jgi:FkbM family methyltransferase